MTTTDQNIHQQIDQAMQRPAWQSPIMPLTDKLWIHPQASRLMTPYTNTLLNIADNGVLTIEGDQACISMDQCKTWQTFALFNTPGMQPAFEYVLVRSKCGVIVLVFSDIASRNDRTWNNQTHEPDKLPARNTWCINSTDEGRSWSKPMLVDDQCGTMIQGIMTDTGRIVIPAQPFLMNPGRWGQRSVYSDDVGVTWHTSNTLDAGGHGHHDGTIEGAITQLNDGRPWLVFRTNLDYFWQSFSSDRGQSWEAPKPTEIDASSSPGWLSRLASGNLLLVWNRLYPQGLSDEQQANWDRAGGDRNSCLSVSSWHRFELSAALSTDDGQSWSSPTVLIRDLRVAYPTVLEPSPGELWITTRFSQRVAIRCQESLLLENN